MSWFGWLGGGGATGVPSEAAAPLSSEPIVSSELQLHSDESIPAGTSSDNSFGSFGLGNFGFGGPTNEAPPEPALPPTPVLALDQLKTAGIPLNRGMTPYLQIDPGMFANTQPQYIMPDGGTTGKGKFEFALGYIGWAVGSGYFVGCARGAIPEFFNSETRALAGRPWMTRMVNATVKHGSGYAQPAGTVVFMYSAMEIAMRYLRGSDDDLNSLASGTLTGAIYRSPHGIRPSAIGGAAGLALSTLWVLVHPDSRRRIFDMFGRD
ncbi:unnamed protein product, partial [Mesorhabditis spiculigera]